MRTKLSTAALITIAMFASPFAADTKPATAELEAAAKLYLEKYETAKAGKFFTFSQGECLSEDTCYWAATSKEKIGNCPAKSVWRMGSGEGCDWNKVPKNCESITPEVISSYNKCN